MVVHFEFTDEERASSLVIVGEKFERVAPEADQP